jgi:HlyD family secretion protein
VKPGQVLVKMDTVTLESQLAEANARPGRPGALGRREGQHHQAEERDRSGGVEATRSQRLVEQGAGSQRELDVRKTKVETTKATLGEATAMLATATEQVEVARKNAATIQTRIDDATLRSPVTGGCCTGWPSRARCWRRAARR